MSSTLVGRVISMAVRSADTGPMREITSATAEQDGGLNVDVRSSRERGITLLSAGQWREVQRELDAGGLPWHTRRANLLIDCERLGDLIGHTVQVGDAQIAVIGETKPCKLMDQQYHGLRAALQPECRGGVHGRVVRGGRIAVGDHVMCPPSA